MLQSPLTVNISNGDGIRTVDRTVTDLEFTKTARGGYDGATLTIPEFADSQDPALGVLARVRIDDKATGKRAYEGNIEEPGKTTDDDGETWQLTVVGNSAILADRRRPYIPIDSDLSAFIAKKATDLNNATAQVGSLPADDDTPALFMQFPNGMPVGNGSTSAMQYRRLRDAGQRLGGFAYSFISGSNPVTYEAQAQATAPGAAELVKQAAFSSTAVNVAPSSAGSSFLVGKDALSLKINRVSGGATTVALDTVWSAFYNVWIRALLKDINGLDISGAGTYADGFVLAHQIVTDALTWFGVPFDPVASFIDTSFTHHFDQVAYPDGVRLPQLLEDLSKPEPDMVWEALETNAAGLLRFNLRKWETEPRYVVDSRDGWTSQGDEASPSNALSVGWTDKRGNPRISPYTTAFRPLDQLGRIRDAEPVNLGSELGSQAAADRLGDALLAQMNNAGNAGELVIARPILDRYTGRLVSPWEIDAGYPVLVTDIDEPVMRMTQMTYKDSDQAARCTLGVPTFDDEELLARLESQRVRHGGGLTSTGLFA